MKKLLISTALVASMGFASSAFAQEIVYEWTITTAAVAASDGPDGIAGNADDVAAVPASTATFYGTLDQYNAATGTKTLVGTVNVDETNSLAGTQASLLDSLLAQADTIQSSLANTSENLANINGSINLDMTRFDTALPDVVAGSTTDGATISEPINATIGNLTTTVIGSLGSGTIANTADLSSIDTLNQAVSATSQALNAQFVNGATGEGPAGLQQIYNLSSNLGALDASVNVNLAGVSLDATTNLADAMASWSTTAIGSLGTGDITSTLTNNASGLTQRLVGTN